MKQSWDLWRSRRLDITSAGGHPWVIKSGTKPSQGGRIGGTIYHCPTSLTVKILSSILGRGPVIVWIGVRQHIEFVINDGILKSVCYCNETFILSGTAFYERTLSKHVISGNASDHHIPLVWCIRMLAHLSMHPNVIRNTHQHEISMKSQNHRYLTWSTLLEATWFQLNIRDSFRIKVTLIS